MILHNGKFKFNDIPRITLDTGDRYYVCPKYGSALPSATTILSKFSDKKEMLIEWENAVGAKKADFIRSEASTLGTLVHTNVEKYLANEERPGGNHFLRKQAREMADQIIEKALPHIDEYYGMEVGLAFPGLYAGTCDLIANYKGQITICDHKSAKKMRTVDMIDDYLFQLGAYSLAFQEMFGEKVNSGAIFMVARNLDYQTFEINGSKFAKAKDDFLRKVDKFYETFTPPDLSGMIVKPLG